MRTLIRGVTIISLLVLLWACTTNSELSIISFDSSPNKEIITVGVNVTLTCEAITANLNTSSLEYTISSQPDVNLETLNNNSVTWVPSNTATVVFTCVVSTGNSSDSSDLTIQPLPRNENSTLNISDFSITSETPLIAGTNVSAMCLASSTIEITPTYSFTIAPELLFQQMDNVINFAVSDTRTYTIACTATIENESISEIIEATALPPDTIINETSTFTITSLTIEPEEDISIGLSVVASCQSNREQASYSFIMQPSTELKVFGQTASILINNKSSALTCISLNNDEYIEKSITIEAAALPLVIESFSTTDTNITIGETVTYTCQSNFSAGDVNYTFFTTLNQQYTINNNQISVIAPETIESIQCIANTDLESTQITILVEGLGPQPLSIASLTAAPPAPSLGQQVSVTCSASGAGDIQYQFSTTTLNPITVFENRAFFSATSSPTNITCSASDQSDTTTKTIVVNSDLSSLLQFKINTYSSDTTNPVEGNLVTLSCSAINGIGNVQYTFSSSPVVNLTTIGDNQVTLTALTSAVDVTCVALDGDSNSDSKTITIVGIPIEEIPLVIDSFDVIDGDAVLGDTIELTCNASGGDGNYTYQFNTLPAIESLTVLDNSASLTISITETITVICLVSDTLNANIVESYTISDIELPSPIIIDFQNFPDTSNFFIGDTVNFNCTPSQGTPPFQVTIDSDTELNKISSTTSSLTILLEQQQIYGIKCTVIDSLGVTETASIQVLSFSENYSDTASYDVTIEYFWSPNSHTNAPEFPQTQAFFTAMLLMTHNSEVNYWSTASTVTQSFQKIAEFGQINDLQTIAQNDTTNTYFVTATSAASTTATITTSIDLQKDFRLLTTVAKIAQSPDWFVGVKNLALLDFNIANLNYDWLPQVVKPLYGYDAGTQQGVSFAVTDEPTQPQEFPHLLSEDQQLIDANFTIEQPFGTITFTLK